MSSSPLRAQAAGSAQLAQHTTLVPRRWDERGYADMGWLKTFHTFSFASYWDHRFPGFSDLRVINEDRVAPAEGFPPHPHKNFEIFSYMLDGELTHRDSMGNVETLRRGQIQFTSSGAGIVHSEYNNNLQTECHFLQIWYIPDQRGLPPRYYTSQSTEEDKRNKLQTLIKPWSTFSPEEQAVTGLLPPGRAIPAHSSLVTRASVLEQGKSVSHIVGTDTGITQQGTERWLYVHVAMTSGYRDPEQPGGDASSPGALTITTGTGTTTLTEGDGAYITGAKVGERVELASVGPSNVEFVLFDLEAKQ